MLGNLQQAHKAFIYGADHAALALMRSVLEAVLRDHYGAAGADLNERIQTAERRGLLGGHANAAALHRLRKKANGILLGGEGGQKYAEQDDTRREKEMISLLLVLRDLIENAPIASHRGQARSSTRHRHTDH